MVKSNVYRFQLVAWMAQWFRTLSSVTLTQVRFPRWILSRTSVKKVELKKFLLGDGINLLLYTSFKLQKFFFKPFAERLHEKITCTPEISRENCQ